MTTQPDKADRVIGPYVMPDGFRIVSGGQTGADRAALDWAIANDVAHGGWCPRGRKAEDGVIAEMYRLVETSSASYLQRTEYNVRDSDATVIFTLSSTLSAGSKRTIEFAQQYRRPCLHLLAQNSLAAFSHFLRRHRVTVLNVAGSRESTAPGIAELVYERLRESIAVQ